MISERKVNSLDEENNAAVKPRVRFAPSPTGRLHLGSARTALFNWLFARGSAGTMVLRFEDTDRERSSEEFEKDIMDSLKWMGLDWDEGPDIGGDFGPYRQSERMPLYREYAEWLLEKGMAYRCFCSPDEIKKRKEETIRRGMSWRYDRKCLGLGESEVMKFEKEKKPFVLRFKVPEMVVRVEDLLRGAVEVDSSEIDDFVIMRSDGSAGFHLAVVVDDITMKITHVIRGDDHLTNAVRHVMLFDAFCEKPPVFVHHSLLMGPDGSKLSKRHGATAVSEFREQGYLPQALVNYLALLSWSPGDEREIFSLEELVREFRLDDLSASKAIFDFDKLNWLNRQHVKLLSGKELAEALVPFLISSGLEEIARLPEEKLVIAVESVRNNIEKLTDAIEPLRIYTVKPGDLSDKAAEELKKTGDVREALETCIEILGSASDADEKTACEIVERMRNVAAQKGWKAKKILWPFRLAVTGRTVGPDLKFLIMFWGPATCAARIKETLGFLEDSVS